MSEFEDWYLRTWTRLQMEAAITRSHRYWVDHTGRIRRIKGKKPIIRKGQRA